MSSVRLLTVFSLGPRHESALAGVAQAGLLALNEGYGDAFKLANGFADPEKAENALVVLARCIKIDWLNFRPP
jgi:hypothetical protein